ncbi:MAG: phosphoribosyltransferase family protein [Bacteroidota bacterium]|nr:phosphoribosyltransferase family protein [Bacteroidota bacterium]MDP4218028.1 phosphoribosyltransferase family protein [Bacteroidota bacterium]MDP4245679.1 phosphoribosyltransferase family protein [Bacteroidota bacterium]MDP4253433.1 phosphoribosyltransferase family protein [Bacteroidota bacterium]MDP4256868.1 phosphoribosyltransferase family protein [Bacteroidota bacterium]
MTTYSLHKITHPDRFGFSPDEYSRFKFGDGTAAAAFGSSLAEGFIRRHMALAPIDEQIVVIPSPYSYIPTATFAMKNHFVYRLNRWLAAGGFPVVQETKVHRTITYKEDYGELSAEERMRLIGNDSFHIDAGFLQGKTLLFLDDIKITGSHERMILKMVGEHRLTNQLFMLYFAELADERIHPNIENRLNYHFVKSIFDLEMIIRSETFLINTRIVKYILNYDFDAYCLFLQNQSDDFVNLLYNMALGNNYHLIEAYSRNLDFLRNYLFNKKNKRIQHGD